MFKNCFPQSSPAYGARGHKTQVADGKGKAWENKEPVEGHQI